MRVLVVNEVSQFHAVESRYDFLGGIMALMSASGQWSDNEITKKSL
jgi:hypothetical protein